jgi:hypothetical protein
MFLQFPCGHQVHVLCGFNLLNHKINTCPLCRCSMGSVTSHTRWKELEAKFHAIKADHRRQRHLMELLDLLEQRMSEDDDRDHYRGELLEYLKYHPMVSYLPISPSSEIFVRLPRSKCVSFPYHPNYLVGHIMLDLERRFEIPIESQRLFKRKYKELIPNQTIEEAQIEPNETLELDVCYLT